MTFRIPELGCYHCLFNKKIKKKHLRTKKITEMFWHRTAIDWLKYQTDGSLYIKRITLAKNIFIRKHKNLFGKCLYTSSDKN